MKKAMKVREVMYGSGVMVGGERRDDERRDDGTFLCCLAVYGRATAIQTKEAVAFKGHEKGHKAKDEGKSLA